MSAKIINRACLLAVATLTLCALLVQGCADSPSSAASGPLAAPANAPGANALANEKLATAPPTDTATPKPQYAVSPTTIATTAPDHTPTPSATPMPTTPTPIPTSTPSGAPMPTPTPAAPAAQCSNGIAVPNPADNSGLVSDCATLLAAKSTLEGASGNLNWSSDIPISDWDGVTIGNDGVSSLSLSHHRLNGEIPSELGNLANLEMLNLFQNQLTGAIPPELGNLSNLTDLHLTSNDLTGEIPPELGNLSNLQTLFLDGNHLTGDIPPELGNLSNLTGLLLYRNELTGAIPPELGNLANLTYLWLYLNQLTGAIPPELGNLANLGALHLHDNQLTGAIPPELGNLANLTELLLYRNELTGAIPTELGDLANLTELSLLSNNLTGAIPPELGNLANLEILYLYDNQLTGEIPPELGNLANLTRLFLYQNELTGAIPPALGNLANLEYLDLRYNQLTGEIPPALSNLANLEYLLLDDNQLTGAIPPELGDLNNIRALSLGVNQLTGEIPDELSNLANLGGLWISDNRLTGAIPPELGSLPNLQGLSLSGNQLTGEIPPELGIPDFWQLHLNDNQLTGPIPPELGNLANIRMLHLNDNRLSGEIPPELGNLSDLWELYLSGNQLTGCIPASLRAHMSSDEIELIGLPFCDAPTATPTPTPTSTPTITPTPTPTPWAPKASHAPLHLRPFTIEDWILRSDAIARVKLLEVDDYIDTDETTSNHRRRHGAELWFEFEVLEYLKGSGNSKIWGVANAPYYRVATKEEAKAVAKYIQDKRDTRWDDREAIVFLGNENASMPSTSHPDRYALSFFIPGKIPEASHSLESVGGWFPLTSPNGASGASGDQRLMLIDPDSNAVSHIAEDTKFWRNTWRALGAFESSDMTTMAVSDLKWLIANESELLRVEQEKQIATVRNRTAPQELTATQTSAGIALRWTFVEADLYFTTSYRISRKASGETEFTKISDVQPQWDVIYEDTTATEPGVTYTYKVTAILKDDIYSRFNTPFGEYGGEAEVSITTANVYRTSTPTPTPATSPAVQ